MTTKDASEGQPGGVSRRSFLRGVGGITGAAMVGTPALGTGAAAAEPDGIVSYPAEGADITLRVNGQSRQLRVLPSTTLLEALRQQLQLTGSKEVCDRGACGACTVLVDGRAVNSCLILAVDAIGSEVVTVEGLTPDGALSSLQKAFAEHDACQCGYCIPGFVVSAHALLEENPRPTRDEAKEGLAGNICRCGTYVRILDAVEAAGKGGAA